MIYLYVCDSCGARVELERSVAHRNDPVKCRNHKGRDGESHVRMRRAYTPPQIIGEPYHLKEGNRFRGDKMDRREYDRKYNDDTRAKNLEKTRAAAREDAQMRGADVVEKKDFQTPELIDVIKQAGARIRG